MGVTCSAWRDAISAIADGEDPELDPRLVNAHVTRCTDCASFREDVHRLSRHVALEQSVPMADVAPQIVRAARIADRLSVWSVLRLGLIVVAVQIAVFAAPALILGESADAGEHAARHLGSFALAYAIGLVVVALRPAKARGMLPTATALAGCLVLTAVVDVARGRSPIVGEIIHHPELLGLVFVWLLAAEPRRVAPGPGDAARPPRLRVVDQATDTARRESS